MSIKKNFFFNTILLISQYIIPLVVFPYISRTFGVEKVGLTNFVDSIVNYFILFSTLGLTLTGIREVAKKRNNRNELNKVFSELLAAHFINTVVISIIYIVFILFYGKFKENQTLYFIGISKLVFNVFLIEWFYRGIENFKYITVRTILIKVIYVILLFVFVKSRNDINIYYVLTCGIIVINGMINCWYARNYVSFKFRDLNLKQHYKSLFTIGLYLLLNSMYTTLNVAYLGLVANNFSVGYYTTSLKLYTIILGLFTALNEVMVPRLSSLIAENNHVAFQGLIRKSIIFVSMFCFPVIMCGMVLAPQIINVIAGPGYEGSIVCFRIIIPLIFVVGIAQIFSNQVLMSLKKDKQLAITSFIGAVIGISLNVALVKTYHELGTSIVVLVSELSVTSILYIYCLKYAKLTLPVKGMLLNFIIALPYLLICYVCQFYFKKHITVIAIAGAISLIYFTLSQIYIIRNEIVIAQLLKINGFYQRVMLKSLNKG